MRSIIYIVRHLLFLDSAILPK